ncbi:MAG: MFS transporter [Betaproteobacteria bacterium RIFCSPLOWO2_02_FULL_63_19]|nr:MAG: MFS transporter [Betaproteobacteria bacterium RIFCSPLOWO2_02_FULL_63_19]
MAMTEKAKSYSVLTMNTLAFTVNFAVWTMFSIIGIRIKAQLGLSDTEFGLLVATPILTGSLVRLPLGMLTDRYGGRIVYFLQMLLVAIPTYGLAFATQYWQYLAIGLFVGLAGGSFAVGIAYTSAWFPKEKQGMAMGIFGAGNAGAAVTNLVAPLIVVAYGWRAVPQVYSISMLIMAVIFWFFTFPDAKQQERKQKNQHLTLAEQFAPLTEARVWRYGLAYYFVFGGFVALALWLPKYYIGEYGLDLRTAAFITLFFTLPSGVIRAAGGFVSDRWGGDTVTWWVFWVCIVCLFLLSYPSTTLTIHGIKGDVSVRIGVGIALFTLLVFIVGVAQGIGKASVYRSLADYYPNNMGSVGGMVGVIGGLGGFSLPIVFGIAADATDVRSSTFMLMFAVLGGVMIWTWAAERSERDAILEKATGLRDQLVREKLLDARAAVGRWLVDWRPDDEAFWQATGRRIALRNLLFSMPALFLSFAVWMVWSVVVIELPKIGFKFTTGELFWLAALPGLSGSGLRLAYSFVVPIFGGRNFTVFSTTTLLLPALWMGLAVQDPGTSYTVFVAIALLCGLGGGNFSASMANISFFFPKRMQGTALGWNAGAGNLGVGVMQAIVPVSIYGGALAFMGGHPQNYSDPAISQVWLQNAGYVWVPFILLATLAAWFGMHNIRGVSATFRDQAVIFQRKHAWMLGWLYGGTFGSFIGFAAAFPTLLATQFPGSGLLKYAFVGPLIGALIRPLGGWLADHLGGARVTYWNFIVMFAASIAILGFLPAGSDPGAAVPFYAAFMVLFLTTGIGNGSVFRMVPTVFMSIHQLWAKGKGEEAMAKAKRDGEIEASVALGFTAAIAAFGLFFVPVAVGVSLQTTGSPHASWYVFIVFYLSCVLGTWWWYRRKDAEIHCD